MLRLEKLELRGFKSFADSTEIKFHEGITAVVGPNGCGKSNIFDSIAWVLGEQSAKSLRGSKMEDVIFNGTATRKSLGLAEVTLTLIATQDINPRSSEIDDIEIKQQDINISEFEINQSNAAETSETNISIVESKKKFDKSVQASKKIIPKVVAGEKITICRRLYRSGDSDYLMNGHICRLRDIQDFFAGTGLGGAQYAIIEQGHIGQILSSKPQERRGLIEEAAGITKFKAKKHLAELKLESTKQNLSRLNDILAEVERQVNILKKQAAKARRYRRLREQIRQYWKYIFVNEYKRLKNSLTELENKLNIVISQEKVLLLEFNNQETKYHIVQTEVNNYLEILEKTKLQYKDAQIELERTHTNIHHQKEQEKEIKTRIINFKSELNTIEEQKILNQQEIINHQQEFEEIKVKILNIDSQLSLQQIEYSQYQQELLKVEKELERLQSQLLIEVSRTEKVKHLKQQVEDNQKRASLQKEHLNKELEKLQNQLIISESEQKKSQTLLSESENKIDTFLIQLDEVNENLEREKLITSQAQQHLENIIREYTRSEDRLASLTDLNEKQAYFSESVQKLLGNKKIQKEFNLIGTLADILNVKPENEVIIEKVIGETLQTILVKTTNDAVNAINWLNKQKSNRVNFLVINENNNNINKNSNILPTSLTNKESKSLLALLGIDNKYIELINNVFPELATAIIVDSLEQAIKVSIENPIILVFTSNGEQVKAGKLLTTSINNSNNANVLQLKREIKELNTNINSLEQEKEKAFYKVNTQKDKVRQLEEEKKEIDLLLRSEERNLTTKQLETTQYNKEKQRIQQQIKTIQVTNENNEKEIEQLAKKLTSTIIDLNQVEEIKLTIENNINQIKLEINVIKPNVEEANKQLTQLNTINAIHQERKKAIIQALNKLEDENKRLINRKERISIEISQLEQRSQEITNNLFNGEKIIANLEKELDLAKQNVEKAEEKLIGSRSNLAKLEITIAELRNSITETREIKSNINIETTKLESELHHLEQNCHNELSENIINLLDSENIVIEGIEDKNHIIDINAVQQLLIEARSKLLELGAVNMMALEELEEAEQRQSFLQKQYKDILESIKSTEEALKEIKIRSRIKFREAFQKINENFSQMFQELFGGGSGEMTLINEEDVLESGIDINAQPPGKRLQNILLLSGGEKAMTALALVLAIFRFRPSPFCILDEVDAPLDDINIGRFTGKIKHMSEQTQFLVITHNKRTMEVASSIYGVTMQEPGMSKLISVNFL